MEPQFIAQTAHEVNKAYCESIGDDSQPSWEDAPDWQKESAINGVYLHIDNPETTPEQSHESWMKEKLDLGWEYGEKKDADKKTHPCIMPYDQLPAAQRTKDFIFKQTVTSLLGYNISYKEPDVGNEKGAMDGEQVGELKYLRTTVCVDLIRKRIDTLVESAKTLPASREIALSITKLQEGLMWLGMSLKVIGEENPFPKKDSEREDSK